MPDRTTDTDVSHVTGGPWRRFFLNRWMLAGVGLVLVYALLGFLLTPWLFKRYVSNYAAEQLKRKALIGEVRVNPFLFTFDAKGFSLKEADGAPIIGFGRLFVDFELSSLFRWAWTFADIRMERPSLHVEIRHDGRLNLTALSDNLSKSEGSPPEAGHPPRLLLQHAEIIDGSFTFSDQSDLTPATETFAPLNIEFKDISTFPDRKGPYTVRANLPGGGTVGWQGQVSLQPIFSQGQLNVSGFKLATAWKFAQDEVNLAEPAGVMDFSTHYRFDYRKHNAFLVLKDSKLAFNGVVLTEKSKRDPILALKTIEVADMSFDLHAREVMVPNISVRDGRIAAWVNEEGVFNWQKLAVRRQPAEVTAPIPGASASTRRPWHLKAGAVNVENVALDYTDRSRATPLTLSINGVNILLNASAEVGAEPSKATVDGLKVKLSHIALSKTGDDISLIAIDMLALDHGRIDMGNRSVVLKRVAATGGGTRVVRGKGGRIRLAEMLAPGDRGKLKREIIETGEKARSQGKPWSFRLDAFDLNDFRAALQDHTIDPAMVYDLQDIRASLKNITNDGKTPIQFDAGFIVVQGGKVNLNGQVSPLVDHAQARAKIVGINLKPLHPVVAKFTSLALESGKVNVSARVKYRAGKSGPQLRVKGSVSVDRLRLNEAVTGERFLEWKKMSANGLTFGLSPHGLQIEEVRLLEPGAKVVIFKDRSINLVKAIKAPNVAGTEKTPNLKQVPAVVPHTNQTLFPVSIDRVRVEKGVVDFADLSLVLPFATRITDFNGGAAGISCDPESRASVSLEGKVDPYGLATVKGKLSPFTPKTFTDIVVSFLNVEMTPLSPYSATFAGRKIASGTLGLNLGYKIKNSELLGDNEVVLEQFTLGDRVEAPNAVNLPLDLAIALLTNAEGKIDVAVPVHGNLDNPKFKYGHVIRQAFINLIKKIVTAPFRALGGILGDKSDKIDAISFYSGSHRLLPPELKKLKKVVHALEKRPKLRLVVQGRFDPKVDGEALRTERVRRALAVQMGVKLTSEQRLGPIALDNAKTQRALEELLERRSGDNAVANFKMRYEKMTGKKAKRVNSALAFFGWESSDTTFYQAMFKELVGQEPLKDNDLRDLAQRRAEAIIKNLKTTGGLDVTRVTLGSSGPAEDASTETVDTRLTLDVIKP
ncbi:MAG: DUF748 domain-containing protein [Desulfobacterales bacterium]|jgi:hypothetical protein